MTSTQHAWMRPLLGAFLFVSALFISTSTHAYCLTALCAAGTTQFAGQQCVPEQTNDCGTPLFWNRACISFSVQEAGSKQVDFGKAKDIVTQSFAAWTSADCGGGQTPSITVEDLSPVSCGNVEYNQTGGNANVIVFRDDVWPHSGAGNTLGLTTVTYNLDTSEIYDADLELNSAAGINLTTSDDQVDYDLGSIITHEAGHFLGLAHSTTADATMYIEYLPGEIGLRTLSSDDTAGICAAYPPGENQGSCDPTPRHGFKGSCGPGPPDDEGEGCTCRWVGRSQPHRRAPLFMALLTFVTLRRRASRRR